MGRTRNIIITVAALSTLGLSACGGGDAVDDAAVEEAPAEDSGDAGFGEFEVAAEEAPGSGDDAAGADEARTGSIGSNEITLQDFGRDVITEVGLTMTTDDVARTVDDIRRLTAANGGAVFSSDVSVEPELDDGTVPGNGRMVVRIPPQDLDRLVGDLDGLGGVSRLTQDSEDVTEQLVDLEIRIRQAQTGIERIEQILTETTDLDTLFQVETELTRRQVELERLLASQRATQDRVDLATLTIDIRYSATPVEVVEEVEDDPGIGDAFRDGWDAFVGALFAIGFVLAVAAPFLLTALVVIGAVLLVARRMRRRSGRHAGPVASIRDDVDRDDTASAETVSERVDEPNPTA